MDSIPIIAFRFYGRYGHFRKPYSNVSSLTYPFPPRTAIAGLLGAILGVPKIKVAETFAEGEMKVAVAIDDKIKTMTHVTNFRQDGFGNIDYSIKVPKKDWTPKALENVRPWNEATQIPMELLRNPSYLLYVNLTNKMDELITRLKNKRYVYTPCLGLSEFLARVEYIPSEGVAKRLSPGNHEICTVVCKGDCSLLLDRLRPEEEHNIQELRVPYLGTADRTFTYKRYLLNLVPKSLPVRMKVAPYQLADKIITFL